MKPKCFTEKKPAKSAKIMTPISTCSQKSDFINVFCRMRPINDEIKKINYRIKDK